MKDFPAHICCHFHSTLAYQCIPNVIGVPDGPVCTNGLKESVARHKIYLKAIANYAYPLEKSLKGKCVHAFWKVRIYAQCTANSLTILSLQLPYSISTYPAASPQILFLSPILNLCKCFLPFPPASFLSPSSFLLGTVHPFLVQICCLSLSSPPVFLPGPISALEKMSEEVAGKAGIST